MSEKELRKWQNKYRLWKAMHPNFKEKHFYLNYQENCELCLFKCSTGKGNRSVFHCPRERLITRNFEEIFVSEDDAAHDKFFCVEWVKYV